jgi:hypothetical protein
MHLSLSPRCGVLPPYFRVVTNYQSTRRHIAGGIILKSGKICLAESSNYLQNCTRSILSIKFVFHFSLKLLWETFFVPLNIYRITLEVRTEMLVGLYVYCSLLISGCRLKWKHVDKCVENYMKISSLVPEWTKGRMSWRTDAWHFCKISLQKGVVLIQEHTFVGSDEVCCALCPCCWDHGPVFTGSLPAFSSEYIHCGTSAFFEFRKMKDNLAGTCC